MCIPAQLSQPNLSVSEKSKIMLRSLGALRTLRSHRRIVADEAAYRALIVACGRCGTDRRVELTKLYGLLRADGIFPNAVTLGQYTKALSAGYSNASVDESTKVGMQVVISSDTKQPEQEYFALEVLDNNLSNLEESGLKWRTGGASSAPAKSVHPMIQVNDAFSQGEQSQPVTISPTKTFDTSTTQRSLKAKRSWLPVCCSSSFLANSNLQGCSGRLDSIRLMAMWSRNSSCRACGYIPLDEEIQGGWDEIHVSHNEICTVSCPRCAGAIMPSICFKEVTVDEILIDPESANEINSISQTNDLNLSGVSRDGDLHHLPPQLESIIKNSQPSDSIIEKGKSGSVAYLSPHNLRMSLEELVMEYGEEVLERDRLRSLNPEVFFNLWWYSARFSLPLPLSVGPMPSESDSNVTAAGLYNYCSFASWDSTLALEACRSAANALMAAQTLSSAPDRLIRDKLFDNPNTDNPLLSFFNLQNYAQGDWDHPDFTESECVICLKVSTT